MSFDFEAINQAREGKIQHTAFDPTSFQLPDLKGPPAPPPMAVSEQTQHIQRLLDRELNTPQEAQPSGSGDLPNALNAEKHQVTLITPQLEKELSQSQSETRSEKLKTQIQGLKQCFQKLSQNPETSEPYREQLLQSIAIIKSCYSGESTPKDFQNKPVLQDLLKCQYMKWQALKEKQTASPPPPEEKILEKLRHQAGSLSPVERAALYQLILIINKLLPFFAPQNEKTEASKLSGKNEETSQNEVQIDLAGFDPGQASRLILQMRSKLQRTCSPEEKASLQKSIEGLEKQQSLYRQQQAEFDPSSFQVPELEGPPAPPPIAVSEQSQQIQRLIDRELKEDQTQQKTGKTAQSAQKSKGQQSTQSQAKIITPQLKKELSQSQSETRSQKLKTQIQALKQCFQQLSQAPESRESYRDQIMKSISMIKSCYSGQAAPKDLESMSVIQPLLKCQYVKWQALKDKKPAVPPPPEERILKKLRQQAGSLSPVERAALYQLILIINKLLPFYAPESESTASSSSTMTESETEHSATNTEDEGQNAQTEQIDLSDFDPLQASRLIMQMRSKLQRTRSPEEKANLQKELERLLKQQSLHRQQQQTQAILRSQKSLSLRTQSLKKQTDAPRALLAKLKNTQHKTAQDCQFLFKQVKEASPIWEAALRQLARIGLSDAQSVFQSEQEKTQSWFKQSALSQDSLQFIKQWWHSFLDLLKELQELSLKMADAARQLESERLLEDMQRCKEAWQTQRASIKKLEQEFLESEDEIQRSQLQKQLWQKYAECLLELPEVNNSSTN